jgi:hypothetical protein
MGIDDPTLRVAAIIRYCCLLLAFWAWDTAAVAQYAVGDRGATGNGNWTVAGIWSTWDGTAWVAGGGVPGTTDRVFILSGQTVVLNGSGQNFIVSDLIVEAGAKLWTENFGTNRYLTLRGSELRCDGQIGDGADFDGISFNFDGTNTLLHGTGLFDASRLRKFSSANAVPMFSYETNLTIDMDIRLRFNSNSTTQIYNNQDNTCIFNVNILAGRTVELTGAVGSGNVAIDGIDGLSNHARGGTITVNGTLLIPGILFLRSNNVNGTPKCRMIINNGGYVRTNQVQAAASGTAVHDFILNNGGTLEIDGTPTAWLQYSELNNTYAFGNTSLTIYSGNGQQDVRPVAGGYGHLRIRGDGNKQLSGATLVKGDLEILDLDDTPVLDVMPANHELTVRGNWTSYGEAGFNERQGLVLFDQGLAQTVNTTGGERFHNWRIQKTGAQYVTMASDVTLVNNLNLPGGNGRLDLDGNTLVLLNGAGNAITGAFANQRHIRSERTDNASRVQWHIGANTGAHLVPFGFAGGSRLFNFNLTSGNAGVVTLSTYGTPPDNLPWPVSPTTVTNLQSSIGLVPDNRDATVNRFWQVDVTGTPVAALTFNYALAELPAAPYNVPLEMRAQRWNSATSTWEFPLPLHTAGAYTVTVNDVTSFGPWTLAPVTSLLPIELLYFQATAVGQVVELDWSTASEKNNAYFTVLRSSDGLHFEELMRVDAVGNSVVRNDYRTADKSPLRGLSYYRLRQTDEDGRAMESPIVPVWFAPVIQEPVAWPNPATDRLWLAGIPDDLRALRVVDMMGREVNTVQAVQDGEGMVLHLGGMAAGRYLVLLEGDGGRTNVPFIKQ